MRLEESTLSTLARAHAIDVDATLAGVTTEREAVLEAALHALGVAANTREEAQRAVDELDAQRWERVLPAVIVKREDWRPDVPVRLHAGTDFTAELRLENGERRQLTPKRDVRASETRAGVEFEEFAVELPSDVPTGYHDLVVTAGDVDHHAVCIVTPTQAKLPKSLRRQPAWGVSTNLYALRSDASWGIGDAADVSELGSWAAAQGADFVHVGSLNADDPVSTIDPDPIRPATREFFDPLAIRIEEIREVGYLSAAEHQLVEWHGDDARRLNSDVEVDRDAVAASKEAALRMIFAVDRRHSRRREFEEFCAERGERLRTYALWCAIAQEYGQDPAGWPKALRVGDSDALDNFATIHADDVEFHMWLQWIVTQQLRRAGSDLRAAGMRLGLMHQLAPGEIVHGFDAWATPERYASDYSAGLQRADGSHLDLGLSALRPDRLMAEGFCAWREVVRSAVSLGGVVSVARPSMLFTQWWSPSSAAGTHLASSCDVRRGFAVRFNHEALIGILLLEASRAGVIVTAGQDDALTDEMRETLRERGVLVSSTVIEDEGAHEPMEFAKRSVASLRPDTSLPTTGFLSDGHVTRHAGQGAGADDERDAAGERPGVSSAVSTERLRVARAAVLTALAERQLVRPRDGVEEQVAALYRYLATAPSLMREIAIADLIGDTYPAGVPGSSDHMSYRRSLVGLDERPVSLDAVISSRRVKRILRAVRS